MNPGDAPNTAGLKKMIAVYRFGSVNEIGGLVSYLAGPEASYITGASIKIDGGFAA
jgi:3-oxoacyl-[acyl-carrier protein] reductase